MVSRDVSKKIARLEHKQEKWFFVSVLAFIMCFINAVVVSGIVVEYYRDVFMFVVPFIFISIFMCLICGYVVEHHFAIKILKLKAGVVDE